MKGNGQLNLTPLEVLEDFFILNNIELIKDDNICDIHIKSLIIDDSGVSKSKLIIYAPSRMLDDRETRWVLMHEFYHDYANLYYKLNDSIVIKKVAEAKVNNKLIKELIPYEDLVYYLKKEVPVWELADIFYVPEYAIRDAIKLYESRILEEYGRYDENDFSI